MRDAGLVELRGDPHGEPGKVSEGSQPKRPSSAARSPRHPASGEVAAPEAARPSRGAVPSAPGVGRPHRDPGRMQRPHAPSPHRWGWRRDSVKGSGLRTWCPPRIPRRVCSESPRPRCWGHEPGQESLPARWERAIAVGIGVDPRGPRLRGCKKAVAHGPRGAGEEVVVRGGVEPPTPALSALASCRHPCRQRPQHRGKHAANSGTRGWGRTTSPLCAVPGFEYPGRVPRTVSDLFDETTSFENLLLAWRRARKAGRVAPGAAAFHYDLEGEVVALRADLRRGTYRPGGYRSFVVTEPKRRLVSAAPFRDRVVHHAVVGVLEPHFERRFVFDSYACRKGKGTHAAVDAGARASPGATAGASSPTSGASSPRWTTRSCSTRCGAWCGARGRSTLLAAHPRRRQGRAEGRGAPRPLPRRRPAGPAPPPGSPDREPDQPVPRQRLPRPGRPLREGGPTRSAATSATPTTSASSTTTGRRWPRRGRASRRRWPRGAWSSTTGRPGSRPARTGCPSWASASSPTAGGDSSARRCGATAVALRRLVDEVAAGRTTAEAARASVRSWRGARRARAHASTPRQIFEEARERWRSKTSPLFVTHLRLPPLAPPPHREVPQDAAHTLTNRLETAVLDFQGAAAPRQPLSRCRRASAPSRRPRPTSTRRASSSVSSPISDISPRRQYEFVAERVAEIGRLLGGWTRATERTA